MLVVVKHRDIKGFLKRFFNLKCTWSSDVLKIDSTESWRKTNHCFDDFFGVRHVEADRESVNASEFFEEQRLALHYRHCALWSDVAEAKHSGAVGHDRNRVFADRVLISKGLIGSDSRANPGHTRGIGHREVFVVANWVKGEHLDLAAFMHFEGAIPPATKYNTLCVLDGCDNFGLVFNALTVDHHGSVE